MSNFILVLGIILIVFNLIFFIKVKRELNMFSERVSFIIEKIIRNEEVEFNPNNETILSKVEHKLKKLCDTLKVKKEIVEKDKENIQSLVSDISHGVKTPLANIKLYTETMLNRDLEKEQRERFLSLVLEEEEKLNFLMEALIKSSRLENGILKIKKEEVNLKEIALEVLDRAVSRADEKKITFNLNLKDILVLGDNKWLKEALLNIIENGIKYSSKNSTMNISIEKGEIFSYIEIKDYGIGIREENINNIFKRFFREDDVYHIEGVGIGLYLARNIVDEVEGFIKVESIKGKGSTFRVYLLNITKL
ncbi:HAMP domain-containing sensor histidine kinase [uncultured Clostridium sp.]|uniref:sensor histidine kinase n=1 Tax=uncultured Clostridium sp. TaxID=59620 RepID=UPI0026068021|nr:HAMP domain-containing sensor histidine kinase [uncultured Clostridium sp.]